MPPPDDLSAAYRGIRERVTALVDGLDSDALLTTAPATPDWSVQDIVAHLTGVTADILDGRLEGVATDPWTDAQVSARRGLAMEDVLAEWAEKGAQVEALLPAVPEGPARQMIFDATTHEHDIRGALGRPGARDADGIAIGFGWALDLLGMLRAGGGHSTLLIRTEHEERLLGEGAPEITVTAERFELFRAVSGRRSTAQIEAFEWDGDVEMGIFSFFPPRPDALVE